MRVLTKLAVVLAAAAVAAAAAARTGGQRAHSNSFSIKRINYGDSIEKDATEETEICLNDEADVLTVPELITIGIKVGAEITDYPVESVTGRCAIIKASRPEYDKEVKYSFALKSSIDDPSVKPDDEATVAFKFERVPRDDKVECNGVVLRRTMIPVDAPKVPAGCLEGAVAGGYCYKKVTTRDEPTEPDPGCLAPFNDASKFEYCEGEGETFVDNGAPAVARSLTYTGATTATLTLADSDDDTLAGVTDVIVLKNDAEAKRITLDLSTGSVPLTDFGPSDASYTACPVKAAFTKYSITDLYVLGTYEEKNDPTAGNAYYQFGFRYADNNHEKFTATTSTDGGDTEDSTVTVNCAPLDPGSRCYGYLPADGSTPLTLSYKDAADTNIIIVNPDLLTSPQP